MGRSSLVGEMSRNLPARAGESPSKSPFSDRGPTPARSVWDRLLGRGRPDLARAAVETALARWSPEGGGPPLDLSAVLLAYRVGAADAREILTALWRKALRACVADDQVSDAEARYLDALRRALGISDREARDVEREIVHPRYQRALSEIIEDRHFSAEERERLTRLGGALRLSPETQRELYATPVSAMVESLWGEVAADHRISPDEFTHFAEVARSWGVDPSFSPAAEAEARRYALYWRIENGELPTVDVPLALQRGEVCHYRSRAHWHELRTKTVTVDLGQIAVRIRIARGVYYRSPRIPPTRVKQDVLTHLDSGDVYITNKRVLFDGQKKNTTIRLGNLIGFQVYADGIELEKGTGKSPVLLLDGDVELAAVVLGAVLARSE